jgi:hypothetical protein
MPLEAGLPRHWLCGPAAPTLGGVLSPYALAVRPRPNALALLRAVLTCQLLVDRAALDHQHDVIGHLSGAPMTQAPRSNTHPGRRARPSTSGRARAARPSSPAFGASPCGGGLGPSPPLPRAWLGGAWARALRPPSPSPPLAGAPPRRRTPRGCPLSRRRSAPWWATRPPRTTASGLRARRTTRGTRAPPVRRRAGRCSRWGCGSRSRRRRAAPKRQRRPVRPHSSPRRRWRASASAWRQLLADALERCPPAWTGRRGKVPVESEGDCRSLGAFSFKEDSIREIRSQTKHYNTYTPAYTPFSPRRTHDSSVRPSFRRNKHASVFH